MRHEIVGHVRIAGLSTTVHIRRGTTIAALNRYLRRHGREDALPIIIDHFVAGLPLVIVQ